MRLWQVCISLFVLGWISACGLAPGASDPVSDSRVLLSARVPNPRAFGDPNAPVKITEFSDFQ